MDLATIELLERLAVMEARESFYAYRRYLNGPKLKLNWWVRQTAAELQQFYEDLKAGRRPKLVMEAPPQHGKSKMIIEFLSWLAGKLPDKRAIYTSFSERLGVRANLTMQRIMDGEKYNKVFPDTRIPSIGSRDGVRSREMIEYIGHDGFFRNTTVRGSITGEGLDLGVVDDPVKGREEANSETVRDMTWDWFTDDFMTRFSDDAGLLAILTRWHHDDPIGRLKKQLGESVKVLSYPAVAVKDEAHRKTGEALFPEHKSLEFLLERKSVMASVNWEALYQQNPQILGGEIIKGHWFKRYKVLPIIKHRFIFADTAQKTKERNDYSVFESWGLGADGDLYLLDLIRGKWEAPELKRRAIAFWAKHAAMDVSTLGQLRKMKVEDKSSGTGLVQSFKDDNSGVLVEGIERVTDKLTRVMDVLGHIENGRVHIPEDAPWVSDFVSECEGFTADDSHMFDDQIDPMVDAINDMLVNNKMDRWARLGR